MTIVAVEVEYGEERTVVSVTADGAIECSVEVCVILTRTLFLAFHNRA